MPGPGRAQEAAPTSPRCSPCLLHHAYQCCVHVPLPHRKWACVQISWFLVQCQCFHADVAQSLPCTETGHPCFYPAKVRALSATWAPLPLWGHFRFGAKPEAQRVSDAMPGAPLRYSAAWPLMLMLTSALAVLLPLQVVPDASLMAPIHSRMPLSVFSPPMLNQPHALHRQGTHLGVQSGFCTCWALHNDGHHPLGILAMPHHRPAVPCCAAAVARMVRQACLVRYREKKARRSYGKTIRYQMRKVNAEKRQRVKGRFVKVGAAARRRLPRHPRASVQASSQLLTRPLCCCCSDRPTCAAPPTPACSTGLQLHALPFLISPSILLQAAIHPHEAHEGADCPHHSPLIPSSPLVTPICGQELQTIQHHQLVATPPASHAGSVV